MSVAASIFEKLCLTLVPSFLGLSIINRITPFLKIYKYAQFYQPARNRQNRQKILIFREIFGYLNEPFLKKGQKSPIIKAIIVQYNIITQILPLSRGFQKIPKKFYRKFLYIFYKIEFWGLWARIADFSIHFKARNKDKYN